MSAVCWCRAVSHCTGKKMKCCRKIVLFFKHGRRTGEKFESLAADRSPKPAGTMYRGTVALYCTDVKVPEARPLRAHRPPPATALPPRIALMAALG